MTWVKRAAGRAVDDRASLVAVVDIGFPGQTVGLCGRYVPTDSVDQRYSAHAGGRSRHRQITRASWPGN